MAITEHERAELKAELKAELRLELTQELEAMAQERAVQILEAHNRCTHVGVEEVQRILEEIGVPDTGLTAEDVQAMIPQQEGYDDEELRGRIFRLQTFANELADRFGVPRMEG